MSKRLVRDHQAGGEMDDLSLSGDASFRLGPKLWLVDLALLRSGDGGFFWPG